MSSTPETALFLLPGEMAWHREPAAITTILGSCIAVCLFDRARGHGGMNHFMVPDATVAGGMSPGKIGENAIAGLLRLAEMAGSKRADLTAHLYGGGAVIGHLGSVGNIGARNIAIAKARLAAAGVPVLREVVGGEVGRRIVLHTASGVADVSEITTQSSSPPPLPQQQPLTAGVHPSSAPAGGAAARILVIDDSPTVRFLLRGAVTGCADLEIVGEAEDPFHAREEILKLNPDVLCLDLIMPNMDGLTFLKRIMQYRPIPTVVVSTIAKAGSAMHSRVMEAGAVAAIDKETLALYQGPDVARRILLPALRQAAARR